MTAVSLIGGRGQSLVAGWCSRLGAGGAELLAIHGFVCYISGLRVLATEPTNMLVLAAGE